MEYTDKENRTEEQNNNPEHSSQKQVGQNRTAEYDKDYTILDGERNDPSSVKNKPNNQAQQNSIGTKQAGSETEGSQNQNGYGNHTQQPGANENMQAANDDPLTNGHVVSNQEEKKDLKEEVDNDGTTTEGR